MWPYYDRARKCVVFKSGAIVNFVNTIPVVRNYICIAAGAAQVMPMSHRFGLVEVLATESKTFTVTNSGQVAANVTLSLTGPNIDQFALGSSNLSVSPGGSGTFTVSFTPLSGGMKNATVRVECTNCPDSGVITVPISGEGLSPAQLNMSPSHINTTPTAPYPLPGETRGPFEARLNNTGQQSAYGTFTLTGDISDFNILYETSPGFGIPPGGYSLVVVTFTPQSGGTKNVTLTFSSTGGSMLTLSVTGTANAPAHISVTPEGYAFPATNVDGGGGAGS